MRIPWVCHKLGVNISGRSRMDEAREYREEDEII